MKFSFFNFFSISIFENHPELSSLKKDYKKPIEQLLKVSSLQFLLRPIKSSHTFIKIKWILFLGIFFSLTLYLCYKNIQSYLNYDVTTSIYEVVEKEPEFPTISFCNEFIKYFNITFLTVEFNLIDLTDNWKNHFQKYEDLSFGPCYRFNSGLNMSNQSIEIKRLKRKGRQSGFQLDFYLDSKIDYGEMIVFIHNRTQMPSTVYNKGYFISAGSNNYFDLKKKMIKKLENPYNDCYKNVSKSSYNKTIINLIRNKNNAYTQKDCIELCRNLKFNEINSCNCSLKDLDENFYKKCNNEQCINKFINDFNRLDLCSDYCPLECDSIRYEIIHILRPILATGKSESGFENYNGNDFQTFENVTKTFFSISVYFEDLKYTLVTQKPRMNFFDLVSNIGNILGLFISFSFITCLEIFEVIFEVLFIYFK